MQFPVALPGEGVVDVVVQTLVPRTVLATSMNGAEVGKHFYLDCVSNGPDAFAKMSKQLLIDLIDAQQHYYKGVSFLFASLDIAADFRAATAYVLESVAGPSLCSVGESCL